MGNADGPECRRRLGPVHPHVHGERRDRQNQRPRPPGSSPRTWGTLLPSGPRTPPYRFIPTYMGNAASLRNGLLNFSVHPHVHGERQMDAGNRAVRLGSSPRTWGTPGPGQVLLRPGRFIPTYMGNAASGGDRRLPATVHPHVHGERWTVQERVYWAYGSSPRTWGTP